MARCNSGECVFEDDLKLDSTVDAAHNDLQSVALTVGQTFGCSPSALSGLGDEALTCTPTKEVTLPQIVLLAREANVVFACALVTPTASGIDNRALTAAQAVAAGL